MLFFLGGGDFLREMRTAKVDMLGRGDIPLTLR